MKTATIPDKICPIQSTNPISSRWQILVIRPANPCTPLDNSKITWIWQVELDLPAELTGFTSWITRICQLELIGFANWIAHFFPKIFRIFCQAEYWDLLAGANRICRPDYKDLPTEGYRICRLDWTIFHQNEKLK